ncbi:hypothetical protein PT974_09837 [Cladobotryum mycophilum]|uniref:Rhodopsin domain-containing protein n=1 Tax=Cladobotryum mycophilum TaxID=491253 RepID=A0ABR0SHA6_9HYPO
MVEDRSHEIIAATATTWGLAVLLVGLRVVSRRIRGLKLWLDDWLIMASLVWSCAQTFTIIGYQTKHGLGKHIQDAPPDAAYAWAVGLFIAEMTYAVGLVFVKWAILAFYWRIFHSLQTIKLPIWIILGIVCAWGIANVLLIIFQCVPVYAFWARFDPHNPLPSTDYHCGVDDKRFFYGSAIPNILTDIILIAVPVPYIYTIRLPFPQKLGLVSVFLVGAFVIIISIVRLVYLMELDLASLDITWNFVNVSMWSSLEGNLAIVCACLPSLKPLFDLVFNGTMRTKTDSTRGSSGLARVKSMPLADIPVTPFKQTFDLEDGIPVPLPTKPKMAAEKTSHYSFLETADNDSDCDVSITKGTSVVLQRKHLPGDPGSAPR